MKDRIAEGIDYYEHRYAELFEDKFRGLEKHGLLDTTDIHEQALGEATDQILTLLKEEIEKVETPEFYDDWGGKSGRVGFEKCRQAILKILES